MNDNYQKKSHLIGRIGLTIAIAFMLGIPAIISSYYGVWPESFKKIITVGSGLLAVFIPTNIAEVISYTPILGTASYLTFLTGNVMNLKLPVVLNSLQLSNTSPGTEEADVISSISVAISSIVTIIIITAGVVLLVPLQPILTSEYIQTSSKYLLPALFGGMIVNFVNNDCGKYICKQKKYITILPMGMVAMINFFIPLSGKEGIAVLFCLFFTIILTFIMYKMQIIKMQDKK